MKWYQVDEDKERQERHRRRQIIKDWKDAANALRTDAKSKGTKILLRESRIASLRIIEDAARTKEQFENVQQIWNDMEIIENWRIAKQEENYKADLPDTELSDIGVVVPKPLDHVYWRQLLGGNFIDVILDCPHEIHDMTTSRPVRDFLTELDESHKEILYYWAIRLWSPQKIAALRGQTDRNIRKVYHNMIDDIRKKMYIRLRPRYIAGEPLTHNQREFCKNYWEQLDERQQSKLTRKSEEEERRRRAEEKKRRS